MKYTLIFMDVPVESDVPIVLEQNNLKLKMAYLIDAFYQLNLPTHLITINNGYIRAYHDSPEPLFVDDKRIPRYFEDVSNNPKIDPQPSYI